MSDQPTAMRLADWLDDLDNESGPVPGAARELRLQHSRIEADEALMRTAVHLLKRYVSETPLGNQPHMITMEADSAITALRKRLESSK